MRASTVLLLVAVAAVAASTAAHAQQYVTPRARYETRAPPPENYPQRSRGVAPSQHQLAGAADEPEQEIEEPDRLTLLLPNSKFDCTARATGYYADDGLNCEVFHYCQDGARHSWICPEGFTFHQVHLICMPPAGDDICSKSSDFHFVNDYLYRPINEEEVRQRPNATLRYSDRYYPENYRGGQEHETYYEQEREAAAAAAAAVRRPVQHHHQQQQPDQHVYVQQSRPRPQVFRSPEEVNIPLQHRRPQHLRPHTYFQ